MAKGDIYQAEHVDVKAWMPAYSIAIDGSFPRTYTPARCLVSSTMLMYNSFVLHLRRSCADMTCRLRSFRSQPCLRTHFPRARTPLKNMRILPYALVLRRKLNLRCVEHRFADAACVAHTWPRQGTACSSRSRANRQHICTAKGECAA